MDCRHYLKQKGGRLVKIRFLKTTLLGMLLASLLVFPIGKERKKVNVIKAKQIALAKVPGRKIMDFIRVKLIIEMLLIILK